MARHYPPGTADVKAANEWRAFLRLAVGLTSPALIALIEQGPARFLEADEKLRRGS